MITAPAIKHQQRRIPRGQALLLALTFLGIFFAVASALLASLSAYAALERHRLHEAQALALAEGALDHAAHELNAGSYTGETNTALGAGTFSVAVSDINANTKQVVATASVPALNPDTRARVSARFSINTSIVAFRYGVQVGASGVSMNNGSQINGTAVSDGPISGSGIITGDAIVASSTPAGSVSGVSVNGSAYAHTLTSCAIGGNAYYASSNSCSVAGTSYSGQVDQPSQPLPITDAQISNFKTQAGAGGVISGSYTLANQKSATLGPKEITGDLSVSNGALLTLTGTVFVHGQVSIGNNATLTVSPSLGAAGAVLIADGAISLQNGAAVSGNGNAGSTLMLLSTTENSAISLNNNNTVGVLLYASAGTVSVSNNTHATQITAYRLSLSNNAVVDYDQGLQSQGFSSGPGGSWAFVPGSYAATL